MSSEVTTAQALGSLNLSSGLRIAAIVLGIASATQLSQSAFGIRFNEEFILILKLVENTIGFIVLPMELVIVNPVVRLLSAQGLDFDLKDHWRNAFVLLWLFNVNVSRSYAPPALILGGQGIGKAINILFRWGWAALSALVGALLAGSVPLGDPAILWWAAAAFFLFLSSDSLFYYLSSWKGESGVIGVLTFTFVILFASVAIGWVEFPVVKGQPPLFWWPVAAFCVQLVVSALVIAFWRRHNSILLDAFVWAVWAVVAVMFAIGLRSAAWADLGHTPSPGLANLAVFVLVVAVIVMIQSILEVLGTSDSPFLWMEQVLNSQRASVGLNILMVLGGAVIVVYLARMIA